MKIDPCSNIWLAHFDHLCWAIEVQACNSSTWCLRQENCCEFEISPTILFQQKKTGEGRSRETRSTISYATVYLLVVIYLFVFNVYFYLCAHVMDSGDHGDQETYQIPGAGVTGSYAMPDLGAGNQIWVLFKSSGNL